MFKFKIHILKLLGFDIYIDASWIIIFSLILWSLAKGLFVHYYPDLPELIRWGMGFVSAIGLFVSIIFHELSHSLVAKKFGLKIESITLFVFGGVAQMKEEPPNAKAEFFIAIAGPIFSLFLSFCFGVLFVLAQNMHLPEPLIGILGYLGAVNLVLALFNLMPAFPTDGGRILRALLWWRYKDIYKATYIASRTGMVFAFLFISLGFFSIIGGNTIGGLWWIVIGYFLFNAANLSFQKCYIDQIFKSRKVKEFMNENPITVTSSITLNELITNYIYRFHFKMFPVTQNGNLLGTISTNEIKEVPFERRNETVVAEVMKKITTQTSANPEEKVADVLSKMNASGISRFPVVKGDKLAGIISLKDLLSFISLKIELEKK